jgi:TRAP-type mannitol/chloroaromatic compound transport system permease large subunit
MSLTTIGILGVLLLLVLLFSNMPVGFVMGVVGFLGFSYIKGLGPGFSIAARDFFEVFSSYGLTVVPLFVFMGQLSFYSGISKRLFDTAYVLLGSRKGGLAMATVGACAGFSAISGSTNATAATMATGYPS